MFEVASGQLALSGFLAETLSGNGTLDLVGTAGYSVVDNEFLSLGGIDKLEVAPGAGNRRITLGTDASASLHSDPLTVDASGESATGSTVVDVTAMTANFELDGGAGTICSSSRWRNSPAVATSFWRRR